jgi:hypothetical protein
MPRTSHAFLLKLLFVKMLFALLITFPFDSQAQHRPGGPGPRPPGGGVHTPTAHTQIYREFIRRQMRYFDRLDVERELRLPRQSQILSLAVVASSNDRHAGLQLMVNGRSQGQSQNVSRFRSTIHFQLPSHQFGALEIQALGDIYVEELIAEVALAPIPGPSPRPGRDVVLSIHQRSTHSLRIPLLATARQQGHQVDGLRIESVIVDGESLGRFSSAEVSLIVNGQSIGFPQRLTLRGSQVVLPLDRFGGVIGHDIRTIQLEVRGEAQINTVILDVARRPGPGPLPAPMLRLSPQREFTGRLSQTLEQALMLPVGHSHRLVTRMVVAMSTRSTGEISFVDTARGPIQRANLDRFTRTHTILLSHPTPLRDIGVNMMGNVRIETIDIEFTR